MSTYTLCAPQHKINGQLRLAGSKSISNRVLIIRALCEEGFSISGLANARDTETLNRLLHSEEKVLDAGAAGTTFRFMTAYLASRPGSQTLTGSERMLQRPIGPLVDALRELGAHIDYLGQEGYPPLAIHSPGEHFGHHSEVSMPAHVSSQYLTALLLIAPTLPHGLTLHLEGELVSRPYLEMTIRLMEQFGAQISWKRNSIKVTAGNYLPKDFVVEADWSAASYYYGMLALAKADSQLILEGLFPASIQGDAILKKLYEPLGIRSIFSGHQLHLVKENIPLPADYSVNCINFPDLAQTLAVSCAGRGLDACLSGLKTLRIKETDRIAALKNELAKVGVTVTPFHNDDEGILIQGQAKWEKVPLFSTYEDHRMAMAFAPLSLLGNIQIEEPEVVRKSYPDFWEDWKKLGWKLQIIKN